MRLRMVLYSQFSQILVLTILNCWNFHASYGMLGSLHPCLNVHFLLWKTQSKLDMNNLPSEIIPGQMHSMLHEHGLLDYQAYA
jgi:hypothetical protein